ncbi:MAG: universal stress protein [Chloroflexaceae bacterium]|nr:universal stress protein [Chloroflexaceae bacterium]
MDTFGPASHDDMLALVIQIALLLLVARLLGELALRLGQPSVIGEILAGVLLGPSLLSTLFPALGAWIVPQNEVQGYLLEAVALIGSIFMLLITGLEIDVALIRRKLRPAIGTSIGGQVFTFISGFVLAYSLPDALLGNPEQRLVFSLFVATTMSVSAIAVISKVLMDLNLFRRDIGQIIIATATLDDTVAWIMFSIVVGLAAGTAITLWSVVEAIGGVLLFLLVSLTLGRVLVERLLTFAQSEIKSRYDVLTLMVVLAFAFGSICKMLHLEAVLGAFVVGILFSQMPTLPEEAVDRLEGLTLGIFAPIFFAVAGLKVNILRLLDPTLLLITVLVFLVAFFGKTAGAFLGARLIGKRDRWTSLSFGAALNARGAVDIIIASIGLSFGILSQDMFTIIVVAAIVASMLAPTMLRWALTHVRSEAQELERLKREELLQESLIANVHRVLLPVRRRDDDEKGQIQAIEAVVLQRIRARSELAITLLTVTDHNERNQSHAFLQRLNRRFFPTDILQKKVVTGSNAADVILAEAQKDYDLMVLGSPDKDNRSDILFTPFVDYVVRASPCPTMLVHAGPMPPDWQPRSILVPTNGSVASKRAAEVGFSLASTGDEEVMVLKVVTQNTNSLRYDAQETFLERQFGIGHQIVDELRTMGEWFGIKTVAEVRLGPDPETVILETARRIRLI